MLECTSSPHTRPVMVIYWRANKTPTTTHRSFGRIREIAREVKPVVGLGIAVGARGCTEPNAREKKNYARNFFVTVVFNLYCVLFLLLREVADESDGCGAKFSVLIVSDKFQGKPLLARHRLVNTVLQEELKSIHAFTQKTLTVEQWEKQKS